MPGFALTAGCRAPVEEVWKLLFDPARFPDAERLDVSRAPGGQLSFGSGIHFCIGAALARIEGQVLFPTMARRFPDLRLDPDAPPPVFRRRLCLGHQQI